MKLKVLAAAAALAVLSCGVARAEWSDVEITRNITCYNHPTGHSRWVTLSSGLLWDPIQMDNDHNNCGGWTTTEWPALDLTVSGTCSWGSGLVTVKSYVSGTSCDQVYGPMLQGVVPETEVSLSPNGSYLGGATVSVSWNVEDMHVSHARYYLQLGDASGVIGGSQTASTSMF